jgi:hypothetical protein
MRGQRRSDFRGLFTSAAENRAPQIVRGALFRVGRYGGVGEKIVNGRPFRGAELRALKRMNERIAAKTARRGAIVALAVRWQRSSDCVYQKLNVLRGRPISYDELKALRAG